MTRESRYVTSGTSVSHSIEMMMRTVPIMQRNASICADVSHVVAIHSSYSALKEARYSALRRT